MSVTDAPETLKSGKVVSIAGPVIDVEFPKDSMPEINSALTFDIVVDGEATQVVAEVAQQIGDGGMRAVAMKPTDGLVRGAEVTQAGHGMQMPVGDVTLGHVWNVMGEPLDVPDPEGCLYMALRNEGVYEASASDASDSPIRSDPL